jgi:putative acetyltransferase
MDWSGVSTLHSNKDSSDPAELSSNVTIRAFQMDDWRQVAELWRQPEVVWGTLQLPYQSLDDLHRRLENPPERLHRLVAVTDEGNVIGLLGLEVGHGRRSHTGYIGMMVHTSFHNQGIGSALMQAAVDLAERWLNLSRVELTVYTDNPAAVHLYEKFGFQIEGTLRRYAYRDGEYVDTYIMARVRE